jgi:hypothetical protein
MFIVPQVVRQDGGRNSAACLIQMAAAKLKWTDRISGSARRRTYASFYEMQAFCKRSDAALKFPPSLEAGGCGAQQKAFQSELAALVKSECCLLCFERGRS